jgi:hypothetical protein
MQYLKQSTAATLKIGPFLDDTDGKTAETTLTIAQADVRLSKNGGNIAQKTEATSCTHDELGIYGCPSCTHDELGIYGCPIDVTDTATLGRLQLWVHESGALPVWHEYTVLPANVYDSLFSTDKLQVDLLQMGGVAQSATDLKDFADAGYDPATSKIEGCKVNDAAEIKTEVEQAGSSLAQILADTGELQTDWANGGRLDLLIDAILADVTGINGDAMRGTNSAALASVCTEARLAELAAANLPTDIDAILADVTGINGDAMRGTDGANTTVPDAAGVAPTAAEIKTEVEQAGSSLAQILTDTGELQTDWANGGRLDLLIDAIKAETDNLPSGLQKNVALSNFSFLMTDSTTNEPKTGLTVTVQISKDGGAFINATNTPATEIGNGAYKIDLTQAERNADISILKATAVGANQTTLMLVSTT